MFYPLGESPPPAPLYVRGKSLARYIHKQKQNL